MTNAMTLILIYIVNFPFLDGDVPRRASYGVYVGCSESSCNCVISLVRFATY